MNKKENTPQEVKITESVDKDKATETTEKKNVVTVKVKQPKDFKVYHNKPVPQPPEDSDESENDVKLYKRHKTEYEYMKPSDFDDWRDEHKAKVIANVKPWQKYKENREDKKRTGCLKDELVINKDDDNTYQYNLYKNSNQKCKGYIYVGEHNFIRMEKRPPILIWILIALLLIGCLIFGIRSCQKAPTDTDGTKSSGIIVDNTGMAKTEYYWIDNLKGTYLVNADNKEIAFYGAREGETVYVQYTVIDNNNKVLKKTGLIKPGYEVRWDAYSALSAGTYNVKYIIKTYDANQAEPENHPLGSTTVSTQIERK